MLDVFSLIFVADTKIILRYDFVAPLMQEQTATMMCEVLLLTLRKFYKKS